MEQSIETRELKMSEALVPVITKLQEELKGLQEQFKVKSEQLSTIVSTLCLQENVDISKQSIELSADYTTLYIKDLPKDNPESTPVEAKESNGKNKK